jgi:uncharacterized protein (DUF433 family)
MEGSDAITIDPEVRGGKACLRGMRITIADVLDAVALHRSWGVLIAEFPYLTEADIRASLEYSAEKMRG